MSLRLRSHRAVLAVLLVSAAWLSPRPARAQNGFSFGNAFSQCRATPPIHNVAYDGRVTFARLMYEGNAGNCYYRGEPSWAHGYGFTDNGPAELNLMRIMGHVSALRPHMDATNVIAIDDPELFKYPVAFLVEGAYLTLTPKQTVNLHDYLMKGGFLIIDDSREDANRGKRGWANLSTVLEQVLPGLYPIEMTPSHPIFHAFFNIPSFNIVPQYYDPGPPVFRGIFEGNDPTKRLIAMINFNTDISNFWEFSARGFAPVAESNEAYKLGVNYLFYALTH